MNEFQIEFSLRRVRQLQVRKTPSLPEVNSSSGYDDIRMASAQADFGFWNVHHQAPQLSYDHQVPFDR